MRSLPLLVLAAALLAAPGCSKSESNPSATSWTFDAAKTIQQTDGSDTAWVRKHSEGLSIDLDLKSDGTYTLKIAGGELPGETHGTYKSGWGEVTLYEETPSGMSDGLRLKSPDKDHMQLVVGGLRATLRRK